jgi:undecaprenyl diphosphate synthase
MAKPLLPSHIGFIPDGNRRWAQAHGLSKESGYDRGIQPGLDLFEQCKDLGVPEISIFCFTQDNTKRPSAQTKAFKSATVEFALQLSRRDAAMLVVGDSGSKQFPAELTPFLVRQGRGMKVNLLVNYGWNWDLDGMSNGGLRSHAISRMDLIVRWGGSSRLSGFLPVQSVYADLHIRPELWPEFQPSHFEQALAWFRKQDRTLGG